MFTGRSGEHRSGAGVNGFAGAGAGSTGRKDGDHSPRKGVNIPGQSRTTPRIPGGRREGAREVRVCRIGGWGMESQGFTRGSAADLPGGHPRRGGSYPGMMFTPDQSADEHPVSEVPPGDGSGIGGRGGESGVNIPGGSGKKVAEPGGRG